MKRIVILTLFFLGFFFQTSSALSYTDSKRDTIVIDSIALTQHLSHTFARFYPLSLLQRIYAYRKKMEADSIHGLGGIKGQYESFSNTITDAPPHLFGINPFIRIYGKEDNYTVVRKFDDLQFPDSLKYKFKEQFQLFKQTYPRKKTAIHKLTEDLENFQANTIHKPRIFTIIDKKFNGDISAYAKSLFDQSILLDASKYQKFLRKPSSFKLANDPGVQFIVYLELYRLWLKQQQEEE